MSDWELKPAQDIGLTHKDRVRSFKRERSIFSGIVGLLWWTVVALIMRVFFRFQVDGRDNLPAALPFVMIGNHSSHFDVVCLMLALSPGSRDRMYPLAAADHFFGEIPIATFTAFVLNALPMDRQGGKGRETMSYLRERLTSERPGFGYALFPEGTRSRDGQISRFRSGIGMLVAGSPVPVVPCYIVGARAAWPAQRGFPRLFKPVRVIVGKPMTFADAAPDQAGCEATAQALEAAVRQLAPST